jgi:hypothetical protein
MNMVLFIFWPLYILIGCGMSSRCKFNSIHVSLSSLLSLCICSNSVLWHCFCAILCICFVALLCSLWMYISLFYVYIVFVSWQVLYPIGWVNLVWINRMQINEWMNEGYVKKTCCRYSEKLRLWSWAETTIANINIIYKKITVIL